MKRNRRHHTSTSLFISIVCYLIFFTFSFLYLYGVQGEMMQLTQHLISGGRTAYRALLFSSLLTLFLSLQAFLLDYFIRYSIRVKALAWIPSFMVLGWLTDVNLTLYDEVIVPTSTWYFLLFLLCYVALTILFGHRMEPRHKPSALQEVLCPNILIMVLGMILTCSVGNTDQRLHHELRMERYACEGDYVRFMESEHKNTTVSPRIMSLRMYVLSRQEMLGDHLFHLPGNLGGSYVLPSLLDSMSCYNMPARVKEHLGMFPLHDMDDIEFLQYATRDTLATAALRDYLLCAYLLDRNLEAFTDSLIAFRGPKKKAEVPVQKKTSKGKSTPIEPVHFSTLPRHYAEALVLYAQSSDMPKAVLDDEVVVKEFRTFTSCLQGETDSLDIKHYKDTYWYYHHFPISE